MVFKRLIKFTWFLILLVFVLVGCDEEGGNGGSAEDEPGQLEIFSWWTAPGEIDALLALVDTFVQEYPNVEVINLATMVGTGEDARQALALRIAEGDPPDTFQLGPRDLRSFTEYNGDPDDNRLEPLDELFEAEGWEDKYPQEVLDTLKYNDSYYLVPVNMHRLNTLYYNKHLVQTPPTTLDEFYTLAEELQNAGITPLAISDQGWFLEIVFFSVLAGSAGIQFHDDFYSGLWDETDSAQVTMLSQAVADFMTVMSYTNANAGEVGWDGAAELVFRGEAAMFVHGDWGKGLFLSLNWVPDVDFGAVAALGSEGEFILNVDTFGLCTGAPNRDNALNFLRVVGSPPAQEAFNKLKGSTPVHSDVDSSSWDTIAQQTVSELEQASIVHVVENNQYIIEDEEGNRLTLQEKLNELVTEVITQEEIIAWMVETYDVATADNSGRQ